MDDRTFDEVLTEEQLDQFIGSTFERLAQLLSSSSNDEDRVTAYMAMETINALLNVKLRNSEEIVKLHQCETQRKEADTQRDLEELSILVEPDPFNKDMRKFEFLEKLNSDSILHQSMMAEVFKEMTGLPHMKKALKKPAHRPPLSTEQMRETLYIYYKNEGSVRATGKDLSLTPKSVRDRLEKICGKDWRNRLSPADASNSYFIVAHMGEK